jgi:hypothetical protein
MGTRSLSEFRQKIKGEYIEQVADQIAIGTAIHKRDFVFLTDLVRDNTELSPDGRDLLADGLLGLLSGEIKRAPHRPSTNFDKSMKIAERVTALEAENWPRKAAIAKVAEEFRCSSRWVSMALSEARKMAITTKRAAEITKGMGAEGEQRIAGQLIQLIRMVVLKGMK